MLLFFIIIQTFSVSSAPGQPWSSGMWLDPAFMWPRSCVLTAVFRVCTLSKTIAGKEDGAKNFQGCSSTIKSLYITAAAWVWWQTVDTFGLAPERETGLIAMTVTQLIHMKLQTDCLFPEHKSLTPTTSEIQSNLSWKNRACHKWRVVRGFSISVFSYVCVSFF